MPWEPSRRLAPNFTLGEFSVSESFPHLVTAIPDRLHGNVERIARTILQPIRDEHGPVKVLSGFRSEALNTAVGGSPTSQHKRAEAADIRVGNPRKVFLWLIARVPQLPVGQAIYYPDRHFLHLALPSARYPEPSYHIQHPAKGLRYRVVVTVAEATYLLDS